MLETPTPKSGDVPASSDLLDIANQWQNLARSSKMTIARTEEKPPIVEPTATVLEKESMPGEESISDAVSEKSAPAIAPSKEPQAGAPETEQSAFALTEEGEVPVEPAAHKEESEASPEASPEASIEQAITVKQDNAVSPKKKAGTNKATTQPSSTENKESDAMVKKDNDAAVGESSEAGINQLRMNVDQLRRKGGELRKELSSMESTKASVANPQNEQGNSGGDEAALKMQTDLMDAAIVASSGGTQEDQNETPGPSAMEEEAQRREKTAVSSKPQVDKGEDVVKRPAAKKAYEQEEQPPKPAPQPPSGQDIVVENLFDGLATTLGGGLGFVIEKGQSTVTGVVCGVASGVASGASCIGGVYGRLRGRKREQLQGKSV